jgi:hypothetical protein
MPATRKVYMRPIPEQRVALPMSVDVTPAAFAKLAEGKYATDMSDPWNVIYEEPWLHFYRASGYWVFGLRFVREGDKYRAAETLMTRDPELMGNDWMPRLGITLDANCAYLQIQLYAMVHAGEPGMQIPQELFDRLHRGQPKYRPLS